MSKPLNLTRQKQKFNRLTVVKRVENSIHQKTRWECICVCGAFTIVNASDLLSGNTKSCGCHRRDRLFKHGRSDTHEYSVWEGMIQRCTNPKNIGYKNYGGRGIIVCKEWLKFENFYNDMGNCSEGLTLERINNDKGYSKDNCKWATCVEQARNKRVSKNSISGVTGVTWNNTVKKWLVQIASNKQTHFLGHFIDLKDAIQARKDGEAKYW